MVSAAAPQCSQTVGSEKKFKYARVAEMYESNALHSHQIVPKKAIDPPIGWMISQRSAARSARLYDAIRPSF
jgi:hypothetical protein